MIETDDKGNVIGYKNINMFPDDVETITMTRQDYDRHMENLIYEDVELKQRIDKAIEYIENNFIDYESAKRDLRLKVSFCVEVGSDELGELLDILKGSDKE